MILIEVAWISGFLMGLAIGMFAEHIINERTEGEKKQ